MKYTADTHSHSYAQWNRISSSSTSGDRHLSRHIYIKQKTNDVGRRMKFDRFESEYRISELERNTSFYGLKCIQFILIILVVWVRLLRTWLSQRYSREIIFDFGFVVFEEIWWRERNTMKKCAFCVWDENHISARAHERPTTNSDYKFISIRR